MKETSKRKPSHIHTIAKTPTKLGDMPGYERISEGLQPGGAIGQYAREEEGGGRAFIQSSRGRAQGDGKLRRKLTVAVSLGLLAVLGVVLSVSGGGQQQQQQQQDESAAANFGSKHAGGSVFVFESSMHTGARLDQGFPSPASFKEECSSSSSSSSDSDSDSDSDGDGDSDSDSADAGGPDTLCPQRSGPGTVVVQSDEKMQEMIGFGGAFTDAATINFYKLPQDVQEKVLDAYFGPSGIEYSVGRIPMGSCDFSVEQYSFDDVPGDYNLTHFDDGVEKDTAQRIPMLLGALKREEGLKLFISPWSPPAWMKAPRDGMQSMNESAMPEGLLQDPNVHAAWALFFSRFISAYKEQGVDMWGLTIQNESENPGPWEACVYTPSSQAKFIRDHLGPIIRRDHPDLKIMAFDHNRDHLITWTKEMLLDEETSQYVDGMAFHWYYASGQRLMDGSVGWAALNTSHHLLGEDKFILSTESCNCPYVEHSLEGGWKRAEHVAHEMIADVNSWSTGWVDWNLMLDYDGGPNHADNLCDSPVICNKNHTDVIFQPMYYFLGHMSKFAKPGARRLKSHVTGDYQRGGGGPSAVLPGFEATLYGCEGSVRQSWELSATGKISLADYYGAQYDWFSPMCLSQELTDFTQSINLVPCDSAEAGTFVHDPQSGRVVLQSEASSPPNADTPVVGAGSGGVGPEEEISPPGESLCLDVLHRSTDDGAMLTLAPCDFDEDHEGGSEQQWQFLEVDGGAGAGSLLSVTTGRCVTAGWPFFTGAAFEMNEESRDRYGKDYAVVVLNEAEEAVEFDLTFPSEEFTVSVVVGPRSIQTILA